MLTLTLIAIIFLAAGFIQGLSGFGSALLAMPLLTLFIDVKTAVPLCILNSLVITLYLSMKMRAHMEREKIMPLFLGSLPGIFIGVNFLIKSDPSMIKLMLGVMIAAYGAWSLAFSPRPRRVHRAWAYIAGFGTGFIGSAFSAGGPPSIIYTTLTGWSRDHIKATLTGFFLITNIITVIAHASGGITDAAVLKYFLASSGFVFAGVYAGSRLYYMTDRQGYIRIILVMLVILGAMMMGSSLKDLM